MTLMTRQSGTRHQVRLSGWARVYVLLMLLALGTLSGCVRNEDAVGSNDDPSVAQNPSDDPPVNTPPAEDPPADPPETDPPVDPPSDPPSDPEEDPPLTDFEAFNMTLHPVLTDPNNSCVGCHGQSQDPMFANADAQMSYDIITSQALVDMLVPDMSRLYERAAFDRHNCGDDASCDSVAGEILAGIQGWIDGVAGVPPMDPPPVDPPDDETPPPVDPDPPMDPPVMTDVMVFENTLYPLLRDTANFCVGCHGVAQIPTFAVADVLIAYNVLVSQQKVDLANPTNSRIYLRPAVDRHNCGGEANCDQIASIFLTGIEAWAADQVVETPPIAAVTSASTNAGNAQDAAGQRVDDNLVAYFAFEEGTGDTTTDSSGVGNPIVLQLEGTAWEPGGGLRNLSGKAQASLADSQKLFNRISVSGEYSVEAWIVADNTAQDGPARIVSYSQDTQVRNFTMGQNAIYYILRNRSSATGPNGTPQLEALQQEVSTSLQHVVMTFDPATGRQIYLDGVFLDSDNQAATLEWDEQQIFVLGNEVTDNRLWQGLFRSVAIHDRALNASQVAQNFDVGLGDLQSLRFDLSATFGANAYIDMLFRNIDANSYLFAEPTFGGAVTGISIKNIRIAVNDVIPVAAQAFRRIDLDSVQPGMQLSPLGAIIPVAQGSAVDQFHLEFEILGNNMGVAETIAPSIPPLPLPDAEEPDIGIRSFSQLNDTMASVTGVDPNSVAIRDLYDNLLGQLPATTDVLSFAPSHQVAIQRLATGYCRELVENNGTCSAVFGSCEIDGAAKGAVSDTLFDRFVGTGLAVQPAKDAVRTEIVSLIDDLGCANGCVGNEAQTTLSAACAAVLSNSALTVN